MIFIVKKIRDIFLVLFFSKTLSLIHIFIKDGKVSAKYGKAEGLSSEVILRMVADEDGGGVFIVTSNSICYMESDRSIMILDYFPYFNNYDLVENKNGMLVVPGSAGIYVVDKKDLLDGKEVEYQLLNSKSGLENALTPNAWNYVDQDENLYFSTDNGVTCMNLNHYNASTRSYRMQMKSVEIDGVRHSVKRGEPLYVCLLYTSSAGRWRCLCFSNADPQI